MKIKDIEIRACRHKDPVMKDSEMRDGKKSVKDFTYPNGEYWKDN